MNSFAEVSLTFSQTGQGELPLRSAAYRSVAFAAIQIDIQDGNWVCDIRAHGKEVIQADELRRRFLAILNDENLRESIESRVMPLRDVVVALAFGSLQN